MDIINLSDFSLIGYCIVDPVKGLLKLFLNVDICIYKNKFIFLGIDSFYIPFKIIDVVDKKKTVYLVVEDFDILSKYKRQNNTCIYTKIRKLLHILTNYCKN